MPAKSVTIENWEDEVLNSDKPVLVDYWAVWCGPCRSMSKILDEIADEHPEVSVVKVNIDENPEIARKYNIQSIPFFARFEDGELVRSAIGAQPKARLKAALLDTITI